MLVSVLVRRIAVYPLPLLNRTSGQFSREYVASHPMFRCIAGSVRFVQIHLSVPGAFLGAPVQVLLEAGNRNNSADVSPMLIIAPVRGHPDCAFF